MRELEQRYSTHGLARSELARGSGEGSEQDVNLVMLLSSTLMLSASLPVFLHRSVSTMRMNATSHWNFYVLYLKGILHGNKFHKAGTSISCIGTKYRLRL